MVVVDKRGILTGMRVIDAMRRHLVQFSADCPLATIIRATIKFKVNAVLIHDGGVPVGVVSKTDLMGAYYAGLGKDTAADTIMAREVLTCGIDDPLETALKKMRKERVHRLYVRAAAGREVAGVLAYPDIVGLMYRLCRNCGKNIFRSGSGKDGVLSDNHIRLYEVMTPHVVSLDQSDTIFQVMEELSANHLGAALITNQDSRPAGVISKTDLNIAYLRGICADLPAEKIMTGPVRGCGSEDFLVEVIRKMIFSGVHRLFVRNESDGQITGVISLTDAARVRSGSCRACMSSRIMSGQGSPES